MFNKIYKSTHSYDDPRNDDPTHQALDISTPKTIPHNLKAMLNISQTKIYLRARIKIQGICYTCSETHIGNSLVHFYLNGDWGKSCVPGQIKYIHSTDGVHYALAIQQQIPLPDDCLDPFAQYLHFPAKTYSSKHSSLELVDLDWIFCHYACWDLSPSYSVVLSLSRVCPSIAQQSTVLLTLYDRNDVYFVLYSDVPIDSSNMIVVPIVVLATEYEPPISSKPSARCLPAFSKSVN